MTFREWKRENHPGMRRRQPTAIIHSGSARTVVDCLCGESTTYATEWKVPKRVREWRAEHDVKCLPPGVTA